MPRSRSSTPRGLRLAARLLLALTLIALPATAAPAAAQAPQLGEASLDAVIDAMTVEEKASLLVGMGMNLPFAVPGLPQPSAEDRAVPERVPGAAGRTHAIPRLGIPSITLADGPAGVRINPTREGEDATYHATAFPVATLLASSWDPSLAETVGAAFGRELREYGADVLLAPGMNLHRNPLGGRNFEYYSEDPLLNGRMAAGFVTGVESEGVGTSLKHYAVNNQEFNRLKSNSIIGQRALRELYLRGFEIAVTEARPWTVMSAYNRVNGTYASQSRALLTTILRDEWGFDGFVMTDWFAGDDPVAMMQAGNDVVMPGGEDPSRAIVAAVEAGELSEAQLDTNVRRVLGIILQSPTFRGYEYSDAPDLEAHAAIARDAATQGMVLLKNHDHTLPLAGGSTVALFGNAAYRPIIGGTGSGDVNEAYSVALVDGLAAAGYAPDEALRRAYASYLEAEEADRPRGNILMPPPPIEEMAVDAATIAGAAARADVGLYTLGRNSGEGGDRAVAGDFELTEAELALIRALSEAFRGAGKPFVVVMNVAGVTEVARWRAAADAILLAWQPGQETGHALADVLSGAVNPSGRLPMSFPVEYADVPSSETFPGEVLPEYADREQPEGFMAMLNPLPTRAVYDEGIFVGYRYYDTFDVEPAYPFGHGLSYTTFEYSGLELSADAFDGELTARVTVTNTGAVAGREVVQLYVAAPDGALVKPASELRAFAKTDVLEPGESATVAFTLDARDLASFDGERSAWVVEGGEYRARAAASSRDTRASAPFSVPGTLVVEEAHDVMAPPVEIDPITPPEDPASASGWELVWADEFDGAAIDRSAWNAEVMPDPYNEELQYYPGRIDDAPGSNAWLEDGVLVIEARREDYEHREYTSARLNTQGKREFLYGRFEARIRQPGEVGMWPAFWLLGGNIDEVGWPRCGEIDVMEGKGRLPRWTSGALHRGPEPARNRITVGEYELDSGSFHDEWHTFAIEWEPGHIRWEVDGELYLEAWKKPGEDPAFWPFDEGHGFFILLNLAVGGWFDDGYPPPADMEPQRLYVDYVRVYQKVEGR